MSVGGERSIKQVTAVKRKQSDMEDCESSFESYKTDEGSSKAKIQKPHG